MAAEVEEAGAAVVHRPGKHLREHAGNQAFGAVARGVAGRFFVLLRRQGRFQQRAVQLAVRGYRQRRQRHKAARRHVSRQRAAQPIAEGGRGRRLGQRLDTGDDGSLPVSIAQEESGRGRDRRVAVQRLFDFLQFDAVAAQLDLAVAPAAELEHAVGAPAPQVARAVETPASGVDREAVRRQVWPVEVTLGQSHPAGHNLTPYARGSGGAAGFQHGNPGVGNGAADRHGPRQRICRNYPMERAKGRVFSGAVAIDEDDAGAGPQRTGGMGDAHRFAASQNQAQALEARRRRIHLPVEQRGGHP